VFPHPTSTGLVDEDDYEAYTYDAAGNRLSLRKRDGSMLSYQYDALNRVIRKTVPSRSELEAAHARDVFYRYDIRGLQTDARFDSLSGHGIQTVYDGFGRATRVTDTMDGITRHLDYQYDNAGNRTQMRFPDAINVNYVYEPGGQFDMIRDHGNAVIADYAYNARGELSRINRDSTAPDQDWTYDAIGRLASTGWSNAGTNNGVAQGPTRFLYDGDALVAEYNASGAMLKRYVHGPNAGTDDPIAEYTGASVAASARSNLYADARGSIVLRTLSTGSGAQINSYDAYGVPGTANGRFQYTGQVWLDELGVYYYKARIYSPRLGRHADRSDRV
jgi:YD repeat-containing protein